MAHHCMAFYCKDVFKYLHSLDFPVVYGPLDSFQYMAELKNGSCINVRPIVD
jgi:hypothetical protein